MLVVNNKMNKELKKCQIYLNVLLHFKLLLEFELYILNYYKIVCNNSLF